MAQANLFSPQTQWGSSLQGLVSALYDPTASTQRAEREAKAERDRMDAELKRAQIDDYKAKREAEAAKRTEQSTMISRVVSDFMGGDPQGAAVMDYRKAGGVQPPVNEVDDEGFKYPMDPMPRPAGYTQQREVDLNRILMALQAERGLGGKSFKSAAEGAESVQQQGYRTALGGDPALGPLDPVKVSQAYFATKGGTPYSQEGGRVLSNVTGTLDETGRQAQASVAKTNAEVVKDRAIAARQGRDDQPLVQVMTPTGPVWQPRGKAVGQPAVLAGAQKVADAMFEPTKPNVTAGQKELQGIEQLKGTIGQFRQAASDPRNFGIAGWLRQTAQDAIQQGNALAQTVGSRADGMVGEIVDLGHEVGVENFDKNLPLLDLYANVLAFQMASALRPGDRVTDKDFKTYRSMIGDAGALANREKALTNIQGIEGLLMNQERIVRNFLSGGRNAPAGAAPPAAAPAAPRVIQYDAQGNRLN